MWGQVVATAVGVAAFVGALGVIARAPGIRWLVRTNIVEPYRRWHTATGEEVARRVVREEVGPLVAKHLEPLDQRVAGIEAELHPNGGLSLRDQVDRVVKQTARREES